MPSSRSQEWRGFATWAGVGALCGFSAVGAASIGLFFLPVAVWALVAAAARVRVWPEGSGLLAGLGSFPLLVGFLNLNSNPCPSSGSGYAGPGVAGPSSCGGFDPVPWFLVGAVLAGVGFLTYVARSR